MKVYLVYEYCSFYDTARDLTEPGFASIEQARESVEKRASEAFKYMSGNSKYNVEGEMVSLWSKEGTELIYEITCEGSITKTGAWNGGLARWSIVEIDIKQVTSH